MSAHDGAAGRSGALAVVGTDTGVGKTVVTAGLTGWLRDRGTEAVAVKPCQTGHPPDDDAQVVAEVCGTADAAVCGPKLEPALAPAVAADVAGTSLSYSHVRSVVERAIEGAPRALVEGIGGLRVPLAEGREVVDLVADLGIPALVVGRAGLGTINHTALTVEALRGRGIPVHGVVLNEFEGGSTAERTNPAVIERLTDRPVWTLPPIEGAIAPHAVGAVREALPAEVLRW